LPGQAPGQEGLESLRLCTEISEAPLSELALVERVARFADFSHPHFAAVRRVERLDGVVGGLALVSQAVPGVRLSDALRQAERKWLEPDLDAATALIQQITAAMSAFHALGRDACHGALAPERVVVCPDGSIAIVEYVLGPALERLQLGRVQLWNLFRVAVPPVAGTARFDQLTDVVQLGILSLALVMGRLLHRDEYPHKVADLLQEYSQPDPLGARHVLSRGLRGWISRLLQLDSRTGFRTACEAEPALSAALAEDGVFKPSKTVVLDYLARCLAESDVPHGTALADTRDSATLTLPPFRVGPGTGIVDRGSGAQRVAVATPEPRPTQVRVLAEVKHDRPASPVHVSGASGLASAPTTVATPAHRQAARWSFVGRSVRVAAICAALLLLWGATYLGARSYLGLSPFGARTGVVRIESRPAGVDVAIDGVPSGVTPVTLELKAGEHTLALTTSKGTTVLPLTVVAGTSTTERVEIRKGQRSTKRPRNQRAPAPPKQATLPQ
jgi:hypothetical protein